MNDEDRKIRNIEDKYGVLLFRMGLTHLFDVGYRNFNKENVEHWVEEIIAEGEANKVNGKRTFISTEYQCQINHCALELSMFSVWTLFAYIKRHIHI